MASGGRRDGGRSWATISRSSRLCAAKASPLGRRARSRRIRVPGEKEPIGDGFWKASGAPIQGAQGEWVAGIRRPTAPAWFRACLKIRRGPATRDFGLGQGGEAGASPPRAVTAEPAQAQAKRTVARRVFAERADWL